MMSKNSSFHKLTELFRNRIWPLAVGLLLYFMYQVVGVFLVLSSLLTNSRLSGASSAVLHSRKLCAMSELFGYSSAGPLLAAILAVILAVQGFSYLDDRRQIDFYESQPIGRRRHFLDTILGSLLIYVFSSTLMKGLGLLAAACMQAIHPGILLTAVYQAFRELCFFLGIYGLASLAMLLCGNVFIALLGTGFFLSAEFMLRLLQQYLREAFFKTVYVMEGDSWLRLLSSPVYYYMRGTGAFSDTITMYNGYGYEMTVERAARYLRLAFPWDLRCLGLAVIFLLLTYLAYTKRPNEAAGCALVFRPVQILVKLSAAVLGGLCTGAFVYSLMGSSTGQMEIAVTFLMILLVTFLLCCLMEIIYAFRFRAALQHARELIPCLLLALLAFSYYCFDLSGYDRYVPRASDIVSARLFFDGDNAVGADGGYVSREHRLLGMTEESSPEVIEAVREIARQSMQYTCDDADYGESFYMNVLYTLKNGRRVARSFRVPEDIDAALMDTVIGSDAYHQETWQLDGYPFETGHGGYARLAYTVDYTDADGSQPTIEAGDALLQEFKEAYAKDEAQYSYSFAHENFAIGQVVLYGDQTPEDAYLQSRQAGYSGSLEDFRKAYARRNDFSLYSEDQPIRCSSYSLSYEVYDSYRNTIAFLKKHDLFRTAVPDISEILSAEVEKRYSTADDAVDPDFFAEDRGMYADSAPGISETGAAEAETSETESASENGDNDGGQIYTAPADIAKLLPRLVSQQYNGRFHTQSQLDAPYTVTLTLRSDKSSYRNTVVFILGVSAS